MEWKNLYRGVMVGVTDLIPGVSGGTVAFILGIYDALLEAISGFFSRDWKKHLGFLLPLGIGIVFAIITFSRFIDYLLEYHFAPTQFFFMGLILGVIPFILKQANIKKNFKSNHYVLMIILAIMLASLAFIKPSETNLITSLSTPVFFGLFFSGWLASMAMLLPGISGSFVLLLIGVYPTAIKALTDFNIPLILTIGAGVAIGFIVSSKAIRYLITHYQNLTYAMIIGLIFGSFFVMYPGVPQGSEIWWSILSFMVGLALTSLFGSDKFMKKSKARA